MRQKIVVGNWKMNMTVETGMALVDEVKNGLREQSADQVKVVIAPPFPFLGKLERSDKIIVAAQNCHSEGSGAFTGEVSASMIASVGCDYCIVGHSERRQYFNEDDRLINKKVSQLLAAGLKPIFCCGETLKQREADQQFKVVENQMQTALQGLKGEELLQVVIAYEPVWAIGTGKTATPDQAQEMHAFIRDKLARVLADDAQQIPILYGGSVKPENAKELFGQPDIDGGLVGGASLDAADFLAIVHAF